MLLKVKYKSVLTIFLSDLLLLLCLINYIFVQNFTLVINYLLYIQDRVNQLTHAAYIIVHMSLVYDEEDIYQLLPPPLTGPSYFYT